VELSINELKDVIALGWGHGVAGGVILWVLGFLLRSIKRMACIGSNVPLNLSE
jgi:hypothetical protein